jgi:DNA-binding response OmpR family regulator
VTKGGSTPTILIVDDEESVLRFVGSLVEEEGYKTIVASKLADAEKLVSKKSFALALVDITLPDGSGLVLAKKIKMEKPDVPVVIMTGFPGGGNVRESLDVEPDAYLLKPVAPAILMSLLNRLVARKIEREKRGSGA